MAIEILVAIALVALAASVIEWLDDYFTTRKSICGGKHRYDLNYEFSTNEKDKQIIENNIEILQRYFPQGIPETLRQLDVEARIEVFKELTEVLSLSFELGIDTLERVEIVDGINEDNLLVFGSYNSSKRYITINKNLICYDLLGSKADNEVIDEVLTHCVETLIHELRHAYQYQACLRYDNGEDISLYDINNRVHEWYENYLDYIEASESFELYCKQPIECDSKKFAAGVIGGYMRRVA